MPKTLFFLCGEASGEMYAVRVAREFRRRFPEVPMEGIGGHRLESEGVKLLRDYTKISVVGVTEILSHLPSIRETLAAAKERIRRGDIGAVVLIDFPEFNFRVGLAARACGIPVIYYIPPQLWAWRTGRARTIAGFTKGAVVLFPFEETLLREYGVNAVFAGHPLLDELEPWLDAQPDPGQFGLPEGKTVIGLLPGSRSGEVSRHLPVLLEAARILLKKHPDICFALPIASPALKEPIEREIKRSDLPVALVESKSYLMFRGLTAAISVSGTVTLELALLGVPSVIIYRTSRISYIIGKMLVKVDRIGLPNIVTGERFLPELIQNDCAPEKIADAMCAMLEDHKKLADIRNKCLSLRDRLRGPGAANAVVDMLETEAREAWV